MIHKETAMALRHGQELWHVHRKNKDGTPLRARVNGKCKTWKREPEKFVLPMKHGLKACFNIDSRSAGDIEGRQYWCLPERWEIEKHWS